MAPTPVVVHSEEELSSVLARLQGAAQGDLELFVPQGSRLARGRLSCRLIQRYAGRAGKRVTLVTPDPVLRRQAETCGLGTREVTGGTPAPATAAAAAAAAAGGPTPGPVPGGPPARLVEHPRRRLGAGAAALLGLAAGLAAAIFYLPSARVTLQADARPFQLPVKATADPGRGPIRVRDAQVSKQASGHFPSTGTQVAGGAAARGQVTFDASGCSQGLLVPRGTRLKGPGGVEFATDLGDVAVGGHGDNHAGSPIVATKPGLAGNVPAGPFQLEDPGAGGCLAISSSDPTAGGADEQKAQVVAAGDLDAARVGLEQTLRQEIQREFSQGARPDERLDPAQVVFTPGPLFADRKAGDAANGFDATLTVKAEAVYYNAGDVNSAFARTALATLPQGRQIAGRVDAEYEVAVGPQGHLTFTGKAVGYSAPRIDRDALTRSLVGVPLGQAEAKLRRQPVQSVDISEYPIGLPVMPLNASRIELAYVVAGGAGGSAPG